MLAVAFQIMQLMKQRYGVRLIAVLRRHAGLEAVRLGVVEDDQSAAGYPAVGTLRTPGLVALRGFVWGAF